MALLYGRAGRLTALFGGFRPGQIMRDGTSYMVGVIALAYVLNFGGEPDWLIASGEESGAPWREKSLLAFFGECDEKDRLTGIGSASLGHNPTEEWISDRTACKTKVYEGPLGVVTWNETLVLLSLYTSYGPGPPERLSALSVFLYK